MAVYILMAIIAYAIGSVNFSIIFSKKFAGFDVREKGIFKWSLGKIRCAVCPNCGYVETYIEDTKKIKELNQKK